MKGCTKLAEELFSARQKHTFRASLKFLNPLRIFWLTCLEELLRIGSNLSFIVAREGGLFAVCRVFGLMMQNLVFRTGAA